MTERTAKAIARVRCTVLSAGLCETCELAPATTYDRRRMVCRGCAAPGVTG